MQAGRCLHCELEFQVVTRSPSRISLRSGSCYVNSSQAAAGRCESLPSGPPKSHPQACIPRRTSARHPVGRPSQEAGRSRPTADMHVCGLGKSVYANLIISCRCTAHSSCLCRQPTLKKRDHYLLDRHGSACFLDLALDLLCLFLVDAFLHRLGATLDEFLRFLETQ